MLFNMTEEEWRTVLDVNLSGTFALVRAAAVVMRERRCGRIVTFTSAAGLEGRAGTSNYAAAKLGVVGLTKAAALDLDRYGVCVNCISPRADTRLTRLVAATRPGGPAGEPAEALGDPADVAPLAVYLASERCTATGRVFFCGGGTVAVYPDFVPSRRVDGVAGLDPAALARVVEDDLLANG
jgi:NAD(P)-dependent dehydrogenase (short-subunit alcohol dehydrogenase family)